MELILLFIVRAVAGFVLGWFVAGTFITRSGVTDSFLINCLVILATLGMMVLGFTGGNK